MEASPRFDLFIFIGRSFQITVHQFLQRNSREVTKDPRGYDWDIYLLFIWCLIAVKNKEFRDRYVTQDLILHLGRRVACWAILVSIGLLLSVYEGFSQETVATDVNVIPTSPVERSVSPTSLSANFFHGLGGG
jgi:hypothetical protein